MVVKGPKTLLAESIAAALGEYFEVDPTQVESNLLKNAKIVLNNTRLLPQRVVMPSKKNAGSVQGVTTGVVEQVAFTWSWSIGSESLVKDATLTIQGLKFKTQLSHVEENSDSNKMTPEIDRLSDISKQERRSSRLQEIKQEGRVQAYIRNQVEQIIDALTLAVTDFEYILELPPEKEFFAGVSVGGKSVELKSLGRQMETGKTSQNLKGHLMNQLTFGSFWVNVTKSASKETETGSEETNHAKTYPLLAPLSYRAIAKRYSGDRFGGMNSGLEVIGLSLPSLSIRNITEDCGIVFYAGLDQLQVLTRFGNIVLSSSASSFDSETTQVEAQDAVESEMATDEEYYADPDPFNSLVDEVLKSSVFQFPISGVSLVLPNSTKVTLEAFVMNYQADGSAMNIEGTEGAGILVNDYKLVETNGGSDGASKSHWRIDFISSAFSVAETENSSKNDDIARVACCRCRPDIVRNVVEGMMLMAEAATDLDTAAPSRAPPTPPSPSTPGWSIIVEKTIELRLEGVPNDSNADTDFIIMSVDSPSVRLPLGSSSQLKCEGLMLGPCSHGEVSASFPRIYQTPSENVILQADETLTATVESIAVAREVQSFLKLFIYAMKTPTETTQDQDRNEPENSISSLERDFKNDVSMDEEQTNLGELQLILPKIDFAISEPKVQIIIEDVHAGPSEFTIKTVSVSEETGTMASVLGLRGTFSPEETRLEVDTVESLYVSNVFHLLKPQRNTYFVFHDDTLLVKLGSIHGKLLTGEGDAQNPEGSTSTTGLYLPFPVKLSLERLLLEKESTQPNTSQSGENVTIKKKSKTDLPFLQVQELELDATPVDAKREGVVENEERDSFANVASLRLHVAELKNKMVHLRNAEIGGLINLDFPEDEIRSFRFCTPDPIKVQAGFPAVDWNRMVSGRDALPPNPSRLPFAHIGKLDLLIAYDFKLVAGKDTSVEISPFDGDSETTSDTLIKHYVDMVKKYAPDFITNTEIMGANVVDTGLATYGAYALKATPYGGAAVGLAGVAGVDAVFGALRAGKRSRGASRDEGYKPGDFGRGIMYLMGEAAKSGEEKRKAQLRKLRGMGDDDDLPADLNLYVNFAIGAAHGAGGYVDQNKAKLGGAAAAGVGMVVGTMIAGPAGGIAGGVIAGAVTGKTIEHIEKKAAKASSVDVSEGNKSPKAPPEANMETIMPDPSLCESIKQKPQGLLYKRRDTFQSQWRPRWFVLDLDIKALAYHYISSKAPPLVETKRSIFGDKKQETTKESDLDPPDYDMGFQPEAEAAMELFDCEVRIEEKLSVPEKHLFAFSITPPKGRGNVWYLSATSKEARFMWTGMLAELTGLVVDETSLVEVCEKVTVEGFADVVGLEDDSLLRA